MVVEVEKWVEELSVWLGEYAWGTARSKSTGCGGRVLSKGARRWLPWIGGPIHGAGPDRPLQQVPQAWLGLVPGPQDLDRARKGGRMASEKAQAGASCC